MLDSKEAPKKRITMICHDADGQIVQITRPFNDDTHWHYIAGQFYQFLAGMGYSLDTEDVSAEW